VVRASVAPRLLPPQITLVTANARSQLIAVIGATLAGAVAEGIQVTAGAAWVLRAAMVVYLAAMILALRLPDQVDSSPAPAAPSTPPPRAYPDEPGRYPRAPGAARGPAGTLPLEQRELTAGDSWMDDEPDGRRRQTGAPTNGGRWRTLTRVGPAVAEAMTGNAVLRAFSGFTFFFFAFLLQTTHFSVSKHVALGALAFAVAAGSIVAMAIGSLLRSRAPQLIMFSVLVVAPAVAAVAAWFFGLPAVIAVAFSAILCASLAKLAQDSIVQREIGDEIRSSTFAVSETLNQVSNVAGGLIGVLVSMLNNGQAGLAIAAAALTAALVLIVARRRRRILTQRADPYPPHPPPPPRTSRVR
jgi:hypothetical protein